MPGLSPYRLSRKTRQRVNAAGNAGIKEPGRLCAARSFRRSTSLLTSLPRPRLPIAIFLDFRVHVPKKRVDSAVLGEVLGEDIALRFHAKVRVVVPFTIPNQSPDGLYLAGR
jgi:hypothetical protein